MSGTDKKSLNGFSLVELMLALGITSIVLLVGMNIQTDNMKMEKKLIGSEERLDDGSTKKSKSDKKSIRAEELLKGVLDPVTGNLIPGKLHVNYVEVDVNTTKRLQKVCESLGLKYLLGKCLVPVYNKCLDGQTACHSAKANGSKQAVVQYKSLAEALCDLEKRGRAPTRKFCL